MSSSNPFKIVQKEMLVLQNKIDKLEERNKDLLNQNKSLRSQITTMQKNAVNDSELDNLRIQNGQLIVELNKYKRVYKEFKELANKL